MSLFLWFRNTPAYLCMLVALCALGLYVNRIVQAEAALPSRASSLEIAGAFAEQRGWSSTHSRTAAAGDPAAAAWIHHFGHASLALQGIHPLEMAVLLYDDGGHSHVVYVTSEGVVSSWRTGRPSGEAFKTSEDALRIALAELTGLGYSLEDYQPPSFSEDGTRLTWLHKLEVDGARAKLDVGFRDGQVSEVGSGLSIPDAARTAYAESIDEGTFWQTRTLRVLALLVFIEFVRRRGRSQLPKREIALLSILILGAHTGKIWFMTWDKVVKAGDFGGEPQDEFVLMFVAGLIALSLFKALPALGALWVLERDRLRSAGLVGLTSLEYLTLAVLNALVMHHMVFPTLEVFRLPTATATDAFLMMRTLASGVEAGITEELIVRGAIMSLLLWLTSRVIRRPAALWACGIVSAALFAFWHVNYPFSPRWARVLELTPLWAYFAVRSYRTGLLPLIIAHVAFDIALGGALLSNVTVLVLLLGGLWERSTRVGLDPTEKESP